MYTRLTNKLHIGGRGGEGISIVCNGDGIELCLKPN